MSKPTLAQVLQVKAWEGKLQEITMLQTDSVMDIMAQMPKGAMIKCSINASKTTTTDCRNKSADEYLRIVVRKSERVLIRKVNSEWVDPAKFLTSMEAAEGQTNTEAKAHSLLVRVGENVYHFKRMEPNRSFAQALMPHQSGRSPLVLRQINKNKDVFTRKTARDTRKALGDVVCSLKRSSLAMGSQPVLSLEA